MRSFAIGLIFLVAFSFTVLSMRPGGLRRQMTFAARRLRLVIVLGGIYVVASTILRLVVQQGPIVDWGLPGLALVLSAVFLILGRDPEPSPSK